ncbi:MAG: hypothetical protein JSW27_25995 [Phycisphaerales bacterium]|nr:MAG: hypothetical protein JSW27_25995 [Phycisphaerales bacterium]
MSRLAFTEINEALPLLEAIPDVSYQRIAKHRKMAAALPGDSEGRFVRIHDGTAGPIGTAVGRYGPGGTEGIGLD